MSDVIRSLLLGIIQGLTEFLPVSSSGHLEILNHLIGSSEGVDSDLMMVILVHVGTAFSILYVFRNDIITIITDLLAFKRSDETQLAFEIILSMIPALVIGLVFEEQIEQLFEGGIWKVGIALIFTATILWLTPNVTQADGSIGWKRALLIGLAQAVAIMPGISRSGMTIAIALMLGVGKKNAARFSFLMVLPVILGKLVLDLGSGEIFSESTPMIPIVLALLSSFIVGVIACKWMIKLVRSYSLKYFAWYCLIVGLMAISLHFYG